MFDFENNNIRMNVNLRNAKDIITFDDEALTLTMKAGASDQQTQPVFDILVTLTDDHPEDPLSKTYPMTLVIVKDYKE